MHQGVYLVVSRVCVVCNKCLKTLKTHYKSDYEDIRSSIFNL